jgi:tight adherence protein C
MKYLSFLFLFFILFSSSATFAQAGKYYNGMNKRETAGILKAECKKEINPSMANCFEVGMLYLGSKKEASRKQGPKWVKKACEGGHDPACKYLKEQNRSSFDYLYIAALVLIGGVVLFITLSIFQEEEEFKAQEKVEEGADAKVKTDHGAILTWSRPFFKRYVSPIVSSMKNKKKIKEKYKKVLASSGLSDYLSTEDFFAFKLFLIIGFPVVFIAVRAFLEEDWPLKLVPVLALVGYIYPDHWVKGKIAQRQQEVMRNMPFAVDMLALSVEAGLDFVAAMTKVVEKAKPSPLTYEFEKLIKEIKIGASRAEALRNMSWRIDLIQVSSFCATLIAADSVGASIGPILKSLSAEIRQKRSADAEKAGATAATKILFPMLFLIVPAVFIIVGAPIALELISAKK